MPWRKKKGDDEKGRSRKEWYIYVPDRHGGRVVRSARTSAKKVAEAYEVMLASIGANGSREFDLLDRVIAGSLSLAELYGAWRDKTLDTLKKSFDNVDLEPFIETWYEAMRNHLREQTRKNYRAAVRTLIPEGMPFRRSELTLGRVSVWIAEMSRGPATQHYRLSALRKFVTFLTEREVIGTNPVDGVKRPKLPPPRCQYLSASEIIRLVERQPSPFREFSAFIHATGADVSDALEQVRVRDVDRVHWEVFVNGDKRESRSRTIRIAEWARPYIEPLLDGRAGSELLFEPSLIDRFKQWRAHTAAVESLVAEGYKLYEGYIPRDSRHTFAVRLVRIGAPLQLVADQLGHKNTRMVARVYGRFVPAQTERDRWERLAAERELLPGDRTAADSPPMTLSTA